MKRLIALSLFILLLVFALPALASEESVITLDDSTPSISSAITLPPDTTGTVKLNLSMASVTLTDEAGNTVFYAEDERIHALELNIAPNTGAHTLIVKRLPDAAVAYVSITGIDNLTMNGESQQVVGSPITFNQSNLLTLDANNPSGTSAISIPAEETGVVSANFVGANAAMQFVDKEGSVVAYAFGGHVDGINLLIGGGDYSLNILSSGQNTVEANVRVMPTDEAGFMVMDTPQAVETVSVSDVNTCAATIVVSSVNLRSGPGTGYSVLQYGYYGEVHPVGGSNNNGAWIVVGTDTGSAWLATNTTQLSGNCNNLEVFNVPYREEQAPQIIITTPQTQTIVVPAAPSTVNNSSSNSYHEDEHEDHDEHEEHDDD